MKRITIVATLAVALGVGAAVATASRAVRDPRSVIGPVTVRPWLAAIFDYRARPTETSLR